VRLLHHAVQDLEQAQACITHKELRAVENWRYFVDTAVYALTQLLASSAVFMS